MKIFSKIIFLGFFSCLLMNLSHARAAEGGDYAPDFEIADTYGKKRSLSDYRGQYVVLEWFNHDCPFVKKHYQSGNMQRLQKKWTEKGVVWFSVNSSAKGKQGHLAPEQANKLFLAKDAKPTAVLLDRDGKLGERYGAETTPHMFVVNPQGWLIYAGAIDNIPSTDLEDVPGAKNYVEQALEEAMADRKVSEPWTKSYGCSVKY